MCCFYTSKFPNLEKDEIDLLSLCVIMFSKSGAKLQINI